MKHSLFRLISIVIFFTFHTHQVYALELSQQEALRITKSHFNGIPTDYYVSDSPDADSIIIFADVEPYINWEHECYTYTFPKLYDGHEPTATVLKHTLPPALPNGLIPIDVSFNVPPAIFNGPLVFESPQPRYGHCSHRTCCRNHAIILSGSTSAEFVENRYWNDCSFIYQTLTKRYLIHKENIHTLINDGGIHSGSITIDENGIESTPNDLDKDGVTDYIMPATLSQLKNLFHNLDIELDPLDHLFIFVVDHGGLYKNSNEAYINLWGGETLSGSDFRMLIESILKKNVFITIVMGQCHSGGFIEHLHGLPNINIATACTVDEESSVLFTESKPLGERFFPYDEFVYQWTCAINGADAFGKEVDADYNKDGLVSMEEAFIYARDHDRVIDTETPQFFTVPNLASYLSFFRLPWTEDLNLLYPVDLSHNVSFTLDNGNLTIYRPTTYNGRLSITIASLSNYSLMGVYLIPDNENSIIMETSKYPEGFYLATVRSDFATLGTFKFHNR